MTKGTTLTEIYGGIAQLGEHLLCKQGVSGSIPLISTTKRPRFVALTKLNTMPTDKFTVVNDVGRESMRTFEE